MLSAIHRFDPIAAWPDKPDGVFAVKAFVASHAISFTIHTNKAVGGKLALLRSMDEMTSFAGSFAGFLVAERRHILAWGERKASITSVWRSPRFSPKHATAESNTSMTIAAKAEAATAAVYFGLGMPLLDGETTCSTDFVRDTSTWGLLDIRGAHVKTPQAITCRRSATTNPAGRPVHRITSCLDANRRRSESSAPLFVQQLHEVDRV